MAVDRSASPLQSGGHREPAVYSVSQSMGQQWRALLVARPQPPNVAFRPCVSARELTAASSSTALDENGLSQNSCVLVARRRVQDTEQITAQLGQDQRGGPLLARRFKTTTAPNAGFAPPHENAPLAP